MTGVLGGGPNPGQQWNPDVYDRNARFVSELGAPVVALLDPQPDEAILDLGCGDGHLTRALAETGARVVGVDGSPAMVDKARELGLDAHVMDGRHLTFTSEFDAVFSNAAMHWMRDLDQVVAGVARALKPGGRFVSEMGGYGNVAAICTALRAVLDRRGQPWPDPYRFPSPAAMGALLERHGFKVESIDLIPRPTPLPTDMEGWLVTFGQPFLDDLPAEDQNRARAEAVELLRPALMDEQGRWIADYVRLRFRASLS